MNVLANFREEPIRSDEVLRSSKGQSCSARFPGICCGDDATTVWAHLNGARFGKGAMIKAHDILGFHACFACHSYYDVGHGTRPLLSSEQLLQCVLGAVCETYVRLVRAKIVTVPQDTERLVSDRVTKPRKPPKQRAKVAGSARSNPAMNGRRDAESPHGPNPNAMRKPSDRAHD
jgi:hypothetical protein